MPATVWEMSWFPSPVASVYFAAFLWLLLLVLVYHLSVTVAKPQERRPRKHWRRGKKRNARGEQPLGEGRCPAQTPPGPTCPLPHLGMSRPLTLSPLPAGFVVLESSGCSRRCCHVHSDMTGIYEVVHQFDRTMEDLTRYLDMLNYETPESSDDSWTSITASEVGSSSSVSLSPSREDPHTSVVASEASSSAEVSLSPSSDDSWTSIMASDAGCSLQASPSTLLDGENMPHASSVQPSLGHPRADLEEQPGLATRPPCREEVDRCLEVNSVQQNQPDLEIQLGAPTPPPEVVDFHSRETEMPISQPKGQHTLERLIPETELLQELGQPASVDETPQTCSSLSPSVTSATRKV
ncbi:uncharacterized protein LOC142601208 [Balearica regulorum gibbericeps]|uniref:uncharacterized protein LOC142601208 n=1 Tax=Balearica regulorum gibbericeps TaxID=100784 RepID=UPI003F5DDE37